MTGDGICMIQSKEVTGWVSYYRKTFFKALMNHGEVSRTWIFSLLL
jgi:hypothetical protein